MGQLRYWIRLATGKEPTPTTYWTDELPTWLAPIVIIGRVVIAIAVTYGLWQLARALL